MAQGRAPVAVLGVLLAAAGGAGCGETSAKVLEQIDAALPPTSNLRMDVLMVHSLSTCAVGYPCRSSNSSQCYVLADGNGTQVNFDPSSVQLLSPTDPRVSSAAQVQCLDLALSDTDVANANSLIAGLRTRVFQLTGGDLNLDIHTHDIASLYASFVSYSAGPFLEPSALEGVGLGDVTRDTDFVFAITGYRDQTSGLMPENGPCSGTNWLAQGPFGGSTYTWLSMNPGCARSVVFMYGWLAQLYFGVRDVAGFTDVQTDPLPSCGQGGRDPTRWFPFVGDCTNDPDTSACGASSCPDSDAFFSHVLSVHWRRGRSFNGNYCADGRMDYDETGIDTGGRCDQIGH